MGRKESVCAGGFCGSAVSLGVCGWTLSSVSRKREGGSHQRGGQETLTGLTSCSSHDGQPDK